MENNYEKNILRLEEIVNLLDGDQMELQKGLELLEEGIRIIKQCNLQLINGKGKLKMLLDENKGFVELDMTEFGVKGEPDGF